MSDAIEMLEDPVTEIENIGKTSLALVQGTLTEFDKVQAGIAALRKTYGNVAFPVATVPGMADAKAARIAIREPRYAVDKAAKAAKDPLNALKRNIDQRAAQITAELLEIETPIHEQIRAEEERKEAEKAARAEEARLEAERIAGLLDAIRTKSLTLLGKPSKEIAAARDELIALEPTKEVYGDRAGEALQAKLQTIATLDSMYATSVQQEEEAERNRTERAELEALRAEQVKRDQEAAAKREAEELAEKARREEAQRLEAEKLASDRAAFAREQEEARKRQQEESDRLAAERAELDQARAAEKKRADDAAEAERAEIARREEEARQERQRQEKEAREAEEVRLAAADAARTKLQAAAPALLAALKDCLAFLEHDIPAGTAEPEKTNARAAIALAE